MNGGGVSWVGLVFILLSTCQGGVPGEGGYGGETSTDPKLTETLVAMRPGKLPWRSQRAPQLSESCQTIAEHLSQSCLGDEIRPKFDPHRPMLNIIGRCWPDLTEIRPSLKSIGRHWPIVDHPTSCLIRLNQLDSGRILADVGPETVNNWPASANLAQIRDETRLQNNFGTTLGQRWIERPGCTHCQTLPKWASIQQMNMREIPPWDNLLLEAIFLQHKKLRDMWSRALELDENPSRHMRHEAELAVPLLGLVGH